MPFILSNPIHTELPGLWGEGSPYEQDTIYDIHSKDPNKPPVNYGAHTLKPHSIAHIDAPAHIIADGQSVDHFFSGSAKKCFYGPAVVLKLEGLKFETVEAQPHVKLWRFSPDDLQSALARIAPAPKQLQKILVTAEGVPINQFGAHDPNYVLVPSVAAAEWMAALPGFNAYGTSWKSSDFEPGSRERPVHKILLRCAILFECLKLDHVPPGEYFMSAFPLNLRGASESPLTPVLFTRAELDW